MTSVNKNILSVITNISKISGEPFESMRKRSTIKSLKSNQIKKNELGF